MATWHSSFVLSWSVLTLMLICSIGHGCVFDCRYDDQTPSSDPNVCAGPKVKLVRVTKLLQSSEFGTKPMATWFTRLLAVQQVLRIDLSKRDISSIAVNGFKCYKFVPYLFEYSMEGDPRLVNPGIHLRELILDDNQLTINPNAIASNLVNVSYLSIQRNMISGLFESPFSGMYSTLINISLDDNQLKYLPPAIFNNIGENELAGQNILITHVLLSLGYNQITMLPDGLIGGTYSNGFATLQLHNNQITTISRSMWNDTHTFFDNFILGLDNNQIDVLPADVFANCYFFSRLILSLKNNGLKELPEAIFDKMPQSITFSFVLDDNEITLLPLGLFNGTTSFDSVTLSLINNQISSLPTNLFFPVTQTPSVTLKLDDNLIKDVGGVFNGWNTVSTVSLSLNNNYINVTGLQTLLKSYTNGTGPLTINMSYNAVTYLPDFLFAGVGDGIIATFAYPKLYVCLSHQRNNGIGLLSSSLFASFQSGYVVQSVKVDHLELDVSNNPQLEIGSQEDFYFYQGNAGKMMTTLVMDMSRTNQTTLPLDAFSEFGNQNINEPNVLTLNFASNNISLGSGFEALSQTIGSFIVGVIVNINLQDNNVKALPLGGFPDFPGTLNLSFNEITVIEDRTFFSSQITTIDLSHNRITYVGSGAFEVSVFLTELDLSHNLLSYIDSNFTDNIPVLQKLTISQNKVHSMPLLIGNNRIFDEDAADDNVLRCDTYLPQLLNCSCKDDLVYNEFCGYGRCSERVTGCEEASALPTYDCSVAPFSVCISHCSSSKYLLAREREATCITYTDCSSTFGENTQGYEFRKATSSTDRVCSACSVCPSGFNSKPCNATANTICTKTFRLSGAAISAIVLVLVLVFVGTVGGTSFIFLRNKGEKTEQELEMSQLLLGEVNEANSRMRKAWEIRESDLTFEKSLASGSFGEVWSATWGHIPVAVKTLHAHLAEFPDEMDEFEREAIFMQSIRHPNLLIFYGAGIKSDGAPFLVVELMAKGSMRMLIKNEALAWTTRSRFALEIAQGMAHLHALDSMHRDLKSDNCLVDIRLHVKVADFGNSRLISAYYGEQQHQREQQQQLLQQQQQQSALSESRKSYRNSDWSKPLTLEVGTLLWMAPELMTRGNSGYGKEVDVYSFGIVMWELLTTKTPWENEFSLTSSVRFEQELTQLVFSGKRPALPACSEEKEYAAYVALMKRCWATEANTRPPFASVAALLVDIAGK